MSTHRGFDSARGARKKGVTILPTKEFSSFLSSPRFPPIMSPVTATLLRHRLRHLRHQIRLNSTSVSPPPPPRFNLPLNHPTYLIWSAWKASY
ncbi:hypothetical protein F2Q68_00021986 [Brassica cretica]|uniref:Uncharacterized protein n=1 Tax=Brassica cretica TaxID=69181 RepID=A0A8S9G990_BRACR|nr:hypothetical protein F2Q68_00021986 [Brassica cretica]